MLPDRLVRWSAIRSAVTHISLTRFCEAPLYVSPKTARNKVAAVAFFPSSSRPLLRTRSSSALTRKVPYKATARAFREKFRAINSNSSYPSEALEGRASLRRARLQFVARCARARLNRMNTCDSGVSYGSISDNIGSADVGFRVKKFFFFLIECFRLKNTGTDIDIRALR